MSALTMEAHLLFKPCLNKYRKSTHKPHLKKLFCKCKSLTPWQVSTQDIQYTFYTNISHRPIPLICSLFTPFPIPTNSDALMCLGNVSIRMEIPGLMAHSTYRHSSADTQRRKDGKCEARSYA